MNTNVVAAIFKRNFSSYFSTPTGYLFICVFVVLCSMAAFWPNEFFNANLANLDQLNHYLPLVLLVFIPAITMSAWADERRQGTDELLLTIPATDFAVVLGKYLATVAIYSVALAFSFFCNQLVLAFLGNPDLGLMVATYIGYWFVGVAMLALGLVASFLTGNLTVAFILGALFNLPLVMASYADTIMPSQLPESLAILFGESAANPAQVVKAWSAGEQFRDFGRGVISLASIAYFVLIVVFSLYVSMVLIGRRHWKAGRRGTPQGFHYFVRAVALAVIVFGAVTILQRAPFTTARADISSERLSALSPDTITLIRELKSDQPVQIDAFISTEVPESYVPVRLNLLNALREFKALGGDKVRVYIHDTEPLSEEADRAEKLYGITAREIVTEVRGVRRADNVYLGAAFTSGLRKVVVPYFEYGLPVEYELARSIATVAQEKRLKLGVLVTEAQLFGGFDMATMNSRPPQAIVEELSKQYEVKQVNPREPITEKFDVLLAVQPSSLGPVEMDNFIAAVRGGQPTAILEDPFPWSMPHVTPTSQPRRPQQNMMMGMGQPPPAPKGNIHSLWGLLGIEFAGQDIVWQAYNPYPEHSLFDANREFVFIDPHAPRTNADTEAFNSSNPISSGLRQVLFPFPGAMRPLNVTAMRFTPLATTGNLSGHITFDSLFVQSPMGPTGFNPNRVSASDGENYILAAYIRGKEEAARMDMSDAQPLVAQSPTGQLPTGEPLVSVEERAADDDGKSVEIRVVVVADLDFMSDIFFYLRAQGDNPNQANHLDTDNVTFILNTLDFLAGDERFINIRKRRPQHRVLTQISEVTKSSRQKAIDNRARYAKEFRDEVARIEKDLNDEVAKIQQQKGLDPRQVMIQSQMVQQANQRKLAIQLEQKQKELDRKNEEIDRQLTLEVRRVQARYKFWAAVIPAIPPLLVGLAVFFSRAAREREGVSRSRLR